MVVQRIINGKKTSTKGFEELYPFESRALDINGHELHYVDQGDGTPVVMVHGNPTWSFYYRHLIQGLTPEFRAIVPDHMGCGFSDKPSPEAYDYTLASRVADLDALISKTAPLGKVNLIVHDWGGMIGLAWAMENINRVNKIVVTNTAGFFLPREKRLPTALWMTKFIKGFGRGAIQGCNGFAGSALFVGSERRLPCPVKKGLIAPYNSIKNRIATLKFVQDIPLAPGDKAWPIVDRVSKTLHRLEPEQLLFLWGARDFVFDLSFYREFRRRFPQSQAHCFEDAGHYLFEDKPEETLTLIRDFLAQ
ncbi:MAG: alpha/beta fold hydrolase [Desulfobacterales bacterium]|nr:alpha/beta fold hydrolase [Desulfobacterales bacterium]